MAGYDFDTLRKSDYGWDGRIYFAKFDEDVELFIDTDASGRISPVQRRAVEQFLAWDDALFAALEGPIFRYYRETFVAHGLEAPVIPSPGDVWLYVYPMVVAIPDYVNGDNTYVDIEFNCEWEAEHGMEWVIRNGRDLLYVGGYGIYSIAPFDRATPVRKQNGWQQGRLAL